MQDKPTKNLIAENEELRARLQEAQETLDAIRRGEVDGLVVSTPKGEQVYTMSGADKPYRVLIEEMREGAIMLSDDNSILYANSGFAKMMKAPLEKIVGTSIGQLVSPAHEFSFKKILSSVRKGTETVTKEITFKTIENTLVPTQVSFNKLQTDSIITTFLVLTDLTQHMHDEIKHYTQELELAQIALSESEQRWETTLRSIGDAVIATDISGKITFLNAVAEKLTGWKLEEASLKSIGKVFRIISEQTRKKVSNPIAKVLEKGVIVGLANHTLLIRKDGTEIPIGDSGAPIKDKNGKITGTVLIFRDITERRTLEKQIEDYSQHLENLVKERTKQLKDAERLAAIGATAGMVGHDIRNPLQTITGELFLAKNELKNLSEDKIKNNLEENLEIIEEQTVYINKIVADLQDYAKPLTPTIEEVDLEKTIQVVLTTINIPKTEPAESIKISYFICKDFPKLKADESYIHRILQNLVINAIQAMPKGGNLKINATRTNGKIEISVQDSGEGIPLEVRSKLFQPLITSKAKGQGFGLAVVKRFTEGLGGTVTFESEIGKGTKFTIQLPA